MALATGNRLGPYEILSLLGSGGMGEVYLARDARLDRDVAVKVLPERIAKDPQALGRFQREVRAVASLSHPNIVTIHDFGTEQGLCYAVMELLEGQTLGRRLKRAPLDWRSAVEIVIGVADGLEAAHAKGVVHRDIKPENIFLLAQGGVKILDFGLARLQQKPDTPHPDITEQFGPATEPGVVMGTVYYMSPEQARGSPADVRSDLFSLGCVLHEMVIGGRPFERASGADTIAALLHEAPPLLSESGRECPAALHRLISRCLEKRPEDRFQSAREVAVVLRGLVQEAALKETANPPLDTTINLPSSAFAARPPSAASVAVLPFVNMSADKENEYFSDGLAEELINVLHKVEGLHVVSRTSAFSFKGKTLNVRQIGEQLNVRTVLEGSVRKSGNRLRISAQLVNVADGYHLWSETYNRQLEDVFAIQDEIAQNIAKALCVILSDKDKRALGKNGNIDVRAYDCYLRGRQFFHQFRRRGFEFACQMFAKAIEIEPNYARAFAGLADCHSLLFTYWVKDEKHLHAADASSRKALELGPDLAEAHVARGLAIMLQKQYDQAAREFEAAIRLDPQLFDAVYFYARTCVAQGKLAEAVQLFERAWQLRPEDYQSSCLKAAALVGLGRKDEAAAIHRRGVEAAEKHLQLHPEDARAYYLGAIALCQIGQTARGLEWAKKAMDIDPDEPMTLYNVACVYAVQGKADEAVDCLANAIKHGFHDKSWIEHDSDFDSLRSHPRFQTLLGGL